MKTWALLAVVLVGCGPEPAPYKYIHQCMAIQSDLELNERIFDYIETAERLYGESFGEDVCGLAKGRHIKVLDALSFECGLAASDGRGRCDGLTAVSGDIFLGKGMKALLHEFLHVRDIDRGELDTSWHGRWTEKGYWKLDAEYELQISVWGLPTL